MCNISLCRLLSPVRVWCRIPSARVCSTHGGEVDEEASSALRSEACEEAGGGAETYAAEFYIRAPPCMGIRRFFGETPERHALARYLVRPSAEAAEFKERRCIA
jgi:hypothetical protein